ncbi:Gldg family protein [Pseudomonas tolaasii]
MRSALLAGMTLVVIFLLFLAFNLVWVNTIPDIRWDFSKQKVHTLSAPARQSLATLDHPVDLYYFNSRADSRKTRAMKRYGTRVEDLLKEYEKAAKGMINLHVIHPAPYSEDAYKASVFGLDDQHGFLGLIGTRAGQVAQRIQAFDPKDEALLDYQISHLIYKLMHPEPPTVGVLSGPTLNESASDVLEQMHQHFNVIELSSNIEEIPTAIETLMVVDPRAMPIQTLYAIEQHVLKGAKLMIFIDPISEMSSNPAPADSRVEGLLTAWGIQMPADKLRVDSLFASLATFSQGEATVLHPARLNVPRQAMAADDISTWKLDSVIVSSSGALMRVKKGRTSLTPLLRSSGHSQLLEVGLLASTTGFDSLTEQTSAPTQPQVIAARVEGPAYSAFPDGVNGHPPGLQKAAHIQVVVVADTDLLADTIINSAPNSNAQFVLNTLDNLTAPEGLAAIRPRTITHQTPQPLKQMREAAEQAYAQSAGERERRLEHTEQEWQRLNPQDKGVITHAVDTNLQLQTLNKERLRLPMELHALKVEAYAHVHRTERYLKLLMIIPVPLMLGACAWVLFLTQCRRRRRFAAAAFH